jgi:hypothetical protein
MVDRSITGEDLIEDLDRLAGHRGCPAVLRCDNGPELACAAMSDWAGERVGLAFIPPGQPWRNQIQDPAAPIGGCRPCSDRDRPRGVKAAAVTQSTVAHVPDLLVLVSLCHDVAR